MTLLDRKEVGSCSCPYDSPCRDLCYIRLSGYCYCAASVAWNSPSWRPRPGAHRNSLRILSSPAAPAALLFRYLHSRSRALLRLRYLPGWIGWQPPRPNSISQCPLQWRGE